MTLPACLVAATALLAAVRGEECSAVDRVAARTESGLVCGTRRVYKTHVYASFRGVPYAKQPLAELRFTELQAAEPWDGYLDASKEGPICPQEDIFYGNIMQPQGMAEDCIHANVHVPWDALPEVDHNETRQVRHLSPYQTGLHKEEMSKVDKRRSTGGLPILVFIHGGGFAFGSGDADLHGPEYLISQGVIVITFNYRLGPFGFLSLNSSAVPGNAGLRDMVTLLRWVQTNARYFGGDPHDVTLGGQSAGASATHLLMLSKPAQGLFHKVILMSGTALRSFLSNSPVATDTSRKAFTEQLGINETDVDVLHQTLNQVPLEKIMAANKILQDEGGLGAFYPVIESEFPGVTAILDQDPELSVAEGRGKNIPMIIGFTDAECESFRARFEEIHMVDQLTKNPLLKLPTPLIYSTPSDKQANKIDMVDKEYFGNLTMDAFLRYCSDAYFKYGAMYTAQKRAELGGEPAYLYQFSYQGEIRPFQRPGEKFTGAAHAEDVTYVFKTNSATEEVKDASLDHKMQLWMQILFTNFIKVGNPAGFDLVEWPPVQSKFEYQDIRAPEYNMTAPTADQLHMIAFFDQLYTSNS